MQQQGLAPDRQQAQVQQFSCPLARDIAAGSHVQSVHTCQESSPAGVAATAKACPDSMGNLAWYQQPALASNIKGLETSKPP